MRGWEREAEKGEEGRWIKRSVGSKGRWKGGRNWRQGGKEERRLGLPQPLCWGFLNSSSLFLLCSPGQSLNQSRGERGAPSRWACRAGP